ncbi:3,4-dihydroxy-2-butanone-4-phosphate synthase [Thermithiobacillus plumbiphilus]|uniref:3,4-dihydroxy-2-butanone 4-phosphate synthase n=1 Tax=Thermithiobacillus plumbiphilus TaxID=1729899 RepID=A0ABU9D3L2_9PROT
MPHISPPEEILADIASGRMVVLMDDEDRENEGDLVMAAEFVTPEHINFMAKHGRGLICLTLTPERCKQLRLPLMVSSNQTAFATNFTVSIEAAQGVTTGISAADRATTVLAAIADQAGPDDIVMPGHIFPLMARPGGVLARAGHTEAACDLAQLAGCKPFGVICEILNEDGSMARLPDLLPYAEQHQLRIGTIADLIAYRRRREPLVERVASTPWPTAHGTFTLHAYFSEVEQETHLALSWGDVQQAGNEPVLVRVQAQSTLCDVFGGGAACEAGIEAALKAITQAPRGVLVYIRNPESAQGLVNKVRDFELQRRGLLPEGGEGDSLRSYGIGAQILADLGVRKAVLLSNHPKKLHGLKGFGLEIVDQEPFGGEP